jgi:membrane peptidoglycan carboxypeptidase
VVIGAVFTLYLGLVFVGIEKHVHLGPQRRVVAARFVEGRRVVDPKVISVADGILEKVVSQGTGTNAILTAPSRPQLGKTGTEDNYTNAWFVGAIPQLSAAVWVGFPQAQISMQPPRTRITCAVFAPELSATLTIDSCWIIERLPSR